MVLVKCPTCGKQTQYEGNEFRPFCSERCKLLDFGAWTEEKFSLPAETSSMTEEELDELQAALEKKARDQEDGDGE
jgi:endogenous inhibitor of DNA gyrase (YacG/DUF329 family)